MERTVILPHHNMAIARLRIHKAVIHARIVWLAPFSHPETQSLLKRLNISYE